MKKSTIRRIRFFLDRCFRSEDPDDYVDPNEDNWGPALGAAAQKAKKHNAELQKLIDELNDELRKENGYEEKKTD